MSMFAPLPSLAGAMQQKRRSQLQEAMMGMNLAQGAMQARSLQEAMTQRAQQQKALEGLQGQFTDPAAKMLAQAGDVRGAIGRQFPEQSQIPEWLAKLQAAGLTPEQQQQVLRAQALGIKSNERMEQDLAIADRGRSNVTQVNRGPGWQIDEKNNRLINKETGETKPILDTTGRPAAQEKDSLKLAGVKSKAATVIGKVDEALGKTGFFSTGFTGEMLGKVPGTGAYDLEKTLDTVKANIGFKELQDMREASPTGGALGQVAVQELNFLQAALGSLDKGQSQEQLRTNLEAVKTHFNNWKAAVEQSYAEQYGAPQAQGPQASGGMPKAGDVVDGYVFKGGDPSNAMNWRKQ